MALHPTGNPHIMLSDVGTFRCFTKVYVLGDWSDTTFDSFREAEAWVRNNVTHKAPRHTTPADESIAPQAPTPLPDHPWPRQEATLPAVPYCPPPPAPVLPVAPLGGQVPSCPAPAPMDPIPRVIGQAPIFPSLKPMPNPETWGVQAKPDLETLRSKPYSVYQLDGADYVTLRDADLDVQSVEHQELVKAMLAMVAPDPLRPGLMETPHRVVKAWKHWTSGYEVDIAALLKVFEDGAENYDQMVIVKDIPIYSKCEHHLADIFGTATIAYIPNGKIVGLSKLSRLADAFARRLQVQERLTAQIADALVEHLDPIGVGVIVKARHMCMESRGICQQGHHTITSALRGAIKDEPQTRAEFLAMTN